MLSVLIVDDHAIVRRGLKIILEEISDRIVTMDEAADCHEALVKIRSSVYDLVLLDISLPGCSGLDLLKQLKTERPDLPVMMLTMYPEEQYAVRALRLGASGYLTKESAPDELVTAIRQVLAGGRYVSVALAERLASELGRRRKEYLIPHEGLSDREFQVACLIAAGKTVGRIAEELTLSEKTVSTYRSRILAKMQLKSNAELTSYAYRHGLVA
jgi:DNA-binding NarL/FixJ family response regulator